MFQNWITGWGDGLDYADCDLVVRYLTEWAPQEGYGKYETQQSFDMHGFAFNFIATSFCRKLKAYPDNGYVYKEKQCHRSTGAKWGGQLFLKLTIFWNPFKGVIMLPQILSSWWRVKHLIFTMHSLPFISNFSLRWHDYSRCQGSVSIHIEI